MQEQTDAPTEIGETSPEVKRYERLKLRASIISLILTLALVTVAALWFGPHLDTWLRGYVGDNRWLRLVAIGFCYAAILEVLLIPLGYWSGFVLEHCFGLSNQTLPRWVWKQVKGWLVGGPIGLVLLLGLYALLWFGGPWWWLWAAFGWLAVSLVLGQLLPVVILPLFYKVTPLDDLSLLERLRGLASGTGLKVEGVYRLHLSAETKKANAALAGLGRTRRVLLGDTLLDQFTPEEIEVVFAHEVGHHVHKHLPKLVVVSVVLAVAGLWLVDLVLHLAAVPLGYTAFSDPAALPLLMLVLTLFGLILSPLQNALSRFFERQCDRYALERTRMPTAYRSAFVKLAKLNKTDPDPHPLVVWLFDDHPPIRERLALAAKQANLSRQPQVLQQFLLGHQPLASAFVYMESFE
jgi:STE24 endopeptidase